MAFSGQKLRDALNSSHFVTLKTSSPRDITETKVNLDKENFQCKNDSRLKTKNKLISSKVNKKGFSKLNSAKIKVKLKEETVSKTASTKADISAHQESVHTNCMSLVKHTETKRKFRINQEKGCKDNMNSNNLISDASIHSSNLEESLHSGIELDKLLKGLDKENDIHIRCQNALILALDCISKDVFAEFQESGSLNTIFQLLSDSHDSINLVLCYSLLLCSLSKNSVTIAEIKVVEESMLLMLKYITVPKYENGTYESVEANCMQMLTGNLETMAHKLCLRIFPGSIDPNDITISSVCCVSLRNLSAHAKEYHQIGISYSFNSETLNYVLGMTGKITQEVISENTAGLESNTSVCIATHTINQCLQVLEYALFINPDDQTSSLHRDNVSFPHCLTRLLGWCITSLFPKQPEKDKVSSALSPFYLSSLVSILKVLSSLTHNADSFAKLGNVKGLMEKVMICTLKVYYESADHQFEVLVLCLELMINLYLTDQKTFLRLCLKKFRVGDYDEMLSIEALIKILCNNLDKIKQVQDVRGLDKEPCEQENESVPDNELVRKAEDSQMQLVLKAADKDMELSTLCSYISVLLVFFVDTKQSFKEFIQERLPVLMTTDAISESRRVLQFASLTGGMSKCGILMLQHTIRVLQNMHQ